jgi:hypothetical protein
MYHLSNLIMSAPSLCIYLEQFAKFLNWENFSMDFSSLPKICHVNTLSLINYTDALFIVSTVVLVSNFCKLELQEHELKTWHNYTKRNFTFLETFSEINSLKKLLCEKHMATILIFLLVTMVILHFGFSYDNLERSFTIKF